jgi:ribosomal protein S18 acetylase RimI-like enzyme
MIHPKLWGLGMGRKLMIDLFTQSQHLGAQTILLEVKLGNLRAQKLYSHLGFGIVGVRSNYYRDGSPALLLNLDLPADPQALQAYLAQLETATYKPKLSLEES